MAMSEEEEKLAKQRERNAKRYADPEKREHDRIQRAKYLATPEGKEKQRAYKASPEYRERNSARVVKRYAEDPEYREKMLARKAVPESREKERMARRKRKATPEGRAKNMIESARGNAIQAGVGCSLDEHRDELIGIIRDGCCHDSGLPFSLNRTGVTVTGKPWNLPSLDRREAGGDYTWDNVRVVLWAVNAMRGDLSIPMFHALCHLLSENLTKRYGPPDLTVLLSDPQKPTEE